MALIQCPECGCQISGLAKSCPGCGVAMKYIHRLPAENGQDNIENQISDIENYVTGSGATQQKILQSQERCTYPTISALNDMDRINETKRDSEDKVKCLKCCIEYSWRMYDSCPLCKARKELSDFEMKYRLLQNHQSETSSHLQKGDEIEFGEICGKPVVWRVMDVDGNRALLLTKDGIGYMPYNRRMWSVKWEKCTLRKYLNGKFYDSCFVDTEQEKIIESDIRNRGNKKYGIPGCRNTKDKVFLLSIEEVVDLFASDEDRVCNVAEYVSDNEKDDELSIGYWWLRSPGRSDSSAAVVKFDGSIAEQGNYVAVEWGIVRPAIWIEYD